MNKNIRDYINLIESAQQGVAEGQDDNGISFQVQKGKNKFATTLSIGNKPVGVYQYDADTGRSIAEVYPEFKGKGLGKLLVLHAIYTAAQLGLDFQEDESRTAEYDNVLDSLSSNGYIVDDDGYWYVTGEGEQYLQQSMKQGVAENFADGKVKGKSRPGRVKRAGASCNGSVTDLRQRAKNASGERAKMYHWCANMKSGRKKTGESLESINENSNRLAYQFSDALNRHYTNVGLPIKITKHFVDQMSNPRNKEPIQVSEIADFFAKLLLKRKKFLQDISDEGSFQVTDLESDITVGFKKNNGVLFAVTLIRGNLLQGSQQRVAI